MKPITMPPMMGLSTNFQHLIWIKKICCRSLFLTSMDVHKAQKSIQRKYDTSGVPQGSAYGPTFFFVFQQHSQYSAKLRLFPVH